MLGAVCNTRLVMKEDVVFGLEAKIIMKNHSCSLHSLLTRLKWAGPGRVEPAALRSASVENGKLCVRLCRGNQNGFQIRAGNISHTRNRSFCNAIQLFYVFPLQKLQSYHGYHGFMRTKTKQKKKTQQKKPRPRPSCVHLVPLRHLRVCVSSQKLISVVQQCQRHLSLGSLIPWHYTDTHLNLCR